MDIEKLSENKIKFVLSSDDLEAFNIDFNSFAYNSPDMQELFWDMMEQAENEYGFKVENSHFVVEAKAGLSEKEDLIIEVTKLNETDDIFEFNKKKVSKKSTTKRPKKKVLSKNLKAIYKMNDFDNLCTGVSKITQYYKGQSSLYKYNDSYYIMFAIKSILPENLQAFDITLREYGKRVSNSLFTQGLLEEYGQNLIDKKAISVLNKYFK